MQPIIPAYTPPDFSCPELKNAPAARFEPAPADGVVPAEFHGTSNYPEYVHTGGGYWLLAQESRMDAVLVLRDEALDVVEPRNVRQGDLVATGRTEDGEEGIYIHTTGFDPPAEQRTDKFVFRTRGTRETPFSRSYDDLYRILQHDRDKGVYQLGSGPGGCL